MQEHGEIDRTVEESLRKSAENAPSAVADHHPEMRTLDARLQEEKRPEMSRQGHQSNPQLHTLSRGERIGALQRQQLKREQAAKAAQPMGAERSGQGMAQREPQKMERSSVTSRVSQSPIPMNHPHNPHSTSGQPEPSVRRRRRQD